MIKHLETARVALITLITPVIALGLGHLLNGEQIGSRLVAGTGLVWRPARTSMADVAA